MRRSAAEMPVIVGRDFIAERREFGLQGHGTVDDTREQPPGRLATGDAVQGTTAAGESCIVCAMPNTRSRRNGQGQA